MPASCFRVSAHPKTLAIVTHGGINSVIEASYFGVPMVGIPLYGDQPAVLARAERLGTAVVVAKARLSVPVLYEALQRAIQSRR